MQHEIHLRGGLGLRGATRTELPRYTTMISAQGERTHAVLQGSDVSACGRDARAWIPMLHIGELLWYAENDHQSDEVDLGEQPPPMAYDARRSSVRGDGPPPALEPTCKQCARKVGTWVPEDRLGRQAAMKLAHAMYEERAEQADGEWGASIAATDLAGLTPCPHCGKGMRWMSSTSTEIRYYCESENRDVTMPQRGQETA
jgi:hypothetical protein